MEAFDRNKAKAAAAAAADPKTGMVTVTAAIDGLKDNGKAYSAGDTLHMHKHLVPVHVERGMVRMQDTPADRQAFPGKTK